MEPTQAPDESKVLVIYTGGTIGMLVGQHGYVPEPYFLTETLRSQTRFHDPLQDSLFSNSTSVQGFRNWSTSSGVSTPKSPTSSPSPGSDESLSPTLLVRSCRPIGNLVATSAGHEAPTRQQCKKISDDLYEAHLPSLVTPKVLVPGNIVTRRIRYVILEWNPLRDSSNMESNDWIRIASEIELNYSFDAFVILHGTDTMCFTSSALSFLLEDLGKTVILTGAQIPLSQLRNDAVENLMGALMIAGHYMIPECCVYFNHTLYRGNRVTKSSTSDLNAFSSPNLAPLVDVGTDIVVNWNDVIRQTSMRRFHAHKEMDPNVVALQLYPGISAASLRTILLEPVRGAVLSTFGAGNAPDRPDLVAVLREVCDRGVVIVAISQCAKGGVGDTYETGRRLLEAGVIPGADMTLESAHTKLSYLLSKSELSVSQVRSLMGVALRGELTPPLRPATSMTPPNLEKFEGVHKLLSQFTRLSCAQSRSNAFSPAINITPPQTPPERPHHRHAQDAAASWSWTASEAASAEAALLPFLVHLAASTDDVDSLTFCLTTAARLDHTPQWGPASGLENCLQPASGMTPLHVASMNGSENCVGVLLRAGALVHMRDALGHTALYYAARQGHEGTVDLLLQAGATLGGQDLNGGYVRLALKTALRNSNYTSIRVWSKAGLGSGEACCEPQK